MTGEAPFTFAPGLIGHEYAGEVVEVGRNVTGLAVGSRVAALPGTPCGQCKGCRRTGSAVFCSNPRRAANGTTGFGGFGEYVTIPAGGAIALPDALSFADGALVEPMACGLHALRMAGMAKGAVVLVLGAGSMALSMIYWARALGAGRIVVASRSAHRREVAMAMGADGFHSFAQDDPDELSALLGAMPDIVAECVGKAGMLAKAIEHVAPQGTVISLGMCQHNEPIMAALEGFVPDQYGRDPREDYRHLLHELELYDPAMLAKPRIAVANKMDRPESAALLAKFKRRYRTAEVMEISCLTGTGLPKLKQQLLKRVSALRRREKISPRRAV